MKNATTTTIVSSANPSNAGQSITFTATVAPQSGQLFPPTGSVTFLDGGTNLGSGVLVGGNNQAVATFSTSTLAPGDHTITAQYGGDSYWLASNGSMTGNPQFVYDKKPIVVTYDGAPSGSTCTLAQAINAANSTNGMVPANYGSSTPAGNCTGAGVGSNLIQLQVESVTLTTIDNYWYGPNSLPPIASDITIIGDGLAAVTTIRAMHTGDPTPITADAFRLFYVSGGMELPAGSLTISYAVLQGGYAKGGDSSDGGGGAGMGGAIFNQGSLTLSNVTLIGNTAQGGSSNYIGGLAGGGGGMGQDGGEHDGGGFGGSLGGSYGGSGSSGIDGGGGGGGGGFIIGADAGTTGPDSGGPGGGNGVLGGAGLGFGGGAAGDGGGGGICNGGLAPSGDGGNFGSGGGGGINPTYGGSGGGGVGGGGGGVNCGGGGGFGGGGGGGYDNGGNSGGPGSGGFGGGGGFSVGFGGGNGGVSGGGGGAGMGGAIFNHTGTVYLVNVTATGNAARGGVSGSGLGAVLFNLNGTVTIDFSTLAGNVISGDNGRSDSSGPEDGTVYSLAYGNNIQDGTASSASLIINNSIIHGTQADSGAGSDVSINLVNGANTNNSTFYDFGNNFVGKFYKASGVIYAGDPLETTDPRLGSLSIHGASPNPLPVLPIGIDSPATDSASGCFEVDASTIVTTDERGATRPYGSNCDVGAYEFDGDYIFANGFGPKE